MSHTTNDRVVSLIAQEFHLPKEELSPQSRLDDLGLDSMDCTSLIMALEAAFAIRVPDAEIHLVHTVSDVVALVEQRLEPTAA